MQRRNTVTPSTTVFTRAAPPAVLVAPSSSAHRSLTADPAPPSSVTVPAGVAKLVFLSPTGRQTGRPVRDPRPGPTPLPPGAAAGQAFLLDGSVVRLVPSAALPRAGLAEAVQVWAVPSRQQRDAGQQPLPVVPPQGGAVWKVPNGLVLACDDLLAIASLTVRADGPLHHLVSVQAGDQPVQVTVRSRPAAPAPPPPALGIPPAGVARRAVVVGVSAYRLINSLEYADDDAVSWTRYLRSRGYEVRLLGDGKSDYAPYQPHDVATEHNVRAAMGWLASATRPGDRAAIITSGHGGGDGRGNSWVCCVDETGVAPHGAAEDGSYTDAEMCADAQRVLDAGAAGLFLFLDNCYSGGALDDVQAALPADRFFLCSTCSDHGYGFDESRWRHGAWTHCFLMRTLDGTLAGEQFPALGRAFDAALELYPYASDPANRPQSGGNRALTL